jgi:hypothetical protein
MDTLMLQKLPSHFNLIAIPSFSFYGQLDALDDFGCRLRRQKWAENRDAGIKYFTHERVVIRYTVGSASISLASDWKNFQPTRITFTETQLSKVLYILSGAIGLPSIANIRLLPSSRFFHQSSVWCGDGSSRKLHTFSQNPVTNNLPFSRHHLCLL